MPTYDYHCACGRSHLIYQPLASFTGHYACDCGKQAQVVIHAPILVKAAADVCYDSPIDGTPITSWDKRNEDLKRHDCVPYDPGMKEDYTRRVQEHERALDRSIDQSVERAVAQMPTKTRGQLYTELVEQGTTCDVMRGGK